MKKVIIFFIVAGIFSIAHAAPFLVCDPDPSATSYVIVIDNGESIETPAPLRFDLSNLPDGSHVIEVMAKNVWGVSSAVPFSFVKQLPLSPINIQMTDDVSMWQESRDNYWASSRTNYWLNKRG